MQPMPKLPFAMVASVALLVACAAPSPVVIPTLPPLPPAAGNCNADAGQFALGQVYTERIAEAVRSRSGARVARPLRPGQMVTLEYAADRINIRLDAADRVIGVACG
jgi:hypothetical protein